MVDIGTKVVMSVSMISAFCVWIGAICGEEKYIFGGLIGFLISGLCFLWR